MRPPYVNCVSDLCRQLTGIPHSPDRFVCKSSLKEPAPPESEIRTRLSEPFFSCADLLIRNDRITIRRKDQLVLLVPDCMFARR